LPHTDRDRQLSVLFAPDFLVQEQLLDTPSGLGLRRANEALGWFLGTDVKACLLSLQLEDQLYIELRAYGMSGFDDQQMADALKKRVGEIPERIEVILAQVYPSVYWRRVALRFPEMVRFLHEYTRVGVEDQQAIVNVVLPGQAGHNLVFGTEMLLSMEGTALTGSAGQSASKKSAVVPTSIEQLLATPMSLSFGQKSLEFAIDDLASDIREAYPALPFPFDIQILGTDLQLNGITRNQQISGFTAKNETISEILTSIVMRANPITTVSAPSELEQKLIWVVGPDPSDAEKQILLITTRDAARREGYKLPAAFQPK
jgi:hypothetical protein